MDFVDVIGYEIWGPIDLVSEVRVKGENDMVVYRDDQGHGIFKRMKKKSFYWYKKDDRSNG